MFEDGLKKFLTIESKGFKKNQKQEQLEQIRLEEIRSVLR